MYARKVVLAASLATVLGLLLPAHSIAQTILYWDTTAGSMTAGSGTWNTSGLNWSYSNTGDQTLGAWPNSGDVANFYASGESAISVVGTVNADGLTFSGSGYTLAGTGTINLTNVTQTPTITVNQSATISTLLSGTAGMTLSGSSILTLTAVPGYSGTTTIGATRWPCSALRRARGPSATPSAAAARWPSKAQPR